MRSTLRALLILSLTIFFAPSLLRADQPSAGNADQLVRAALEAELQDAGDRRQQLLAEAISADPNHAPARWHAGYVRLGDEWLKLAEAQRRLADDPRLAAYHKRRDGLVETAEHHRELARWCEKNKLRDVAQVHWTRVLSFDAQDAEAIEGLALDPRSQKRQQAERQKLAAAERKRVMSQWKPRLDAWRKTLAKGDAEEFENLLTEISEIKDAEAVPALLTVLSYSQPGPKAAPLRETVFRTLGNIRSPEVTQYFLGLAMNSAPSETRDAAIEELKKRPAYAFVPQLLSALPPEITAEGGVRVLPSGTVVHEQKVRVDSPKAEYTYSFENVINPADVAAAARTTPRALNRELQRAGAIETEVRAAQQQADQRRKQIEEVLTRTTEFSSAADASDWQKQYEDYYAMYTPATEKQYLSQHERSYEHYYTRPTTTTTTTSRRLEPLPLPRECFAAGTLVTTAGGPRPIESLKLGDRVLAQDVATGELTFKPLLDTTLRPAVEMIEIRCGSAAPIVAAAGHPFWVVGQGWQIARLLKPGDRLHSADGAVTVDGVQSKPPSEAYNLMVQDFNTYFVGEDQLLVHDNAPLVEQPQRVPGL